MRTRVLRRPIVFLHFNCGTCVRCTVLIIFIKTVCCNIRSLQYSPLYLLTHSTQHSLSWEASRFSTSQEIPRILWNPKVHYRIHKCLPPVPILSQLDPINTPTSYFLKIHLITILPSTPVSPKWSLSLRFPQQNPIYVSPFPIRVTWPAHLILHYFITRKILGHQYRLLSSGPLIAVTFEYDVYFTVQELLKEDGTRRYGDTMYNACDERMAVDQWRNDTVRQNPKFWEKILSQRHSMQ